MRQPGEWIHGKYQVQRVLGAGGMGTVYATKRRNESQAAVKVLHPRFAHDKSIRARFLEEGYLANRVGHPAVVTILEDDIDEEGNFYIVMELLDGVDLGKFVGPPRTPISTGQALNIADQLLAALEKAHQKGIVHRDIKPANVMILRDGRVKLLDFGIAKALSADGTVSATEDDEEGAIGTDRYMSPEQGNGFFEDIDARSDLWSLGALLMAILADEDSSTIPLWDQSYEDRAWTFSRLGKDVPPHVVQIISLALQPQKSKRWVTASAMKEAVVAAHSDLYGPPTREELAVLAKTQLHSSPEALGSVESHTEEAPVVIEPTYPSRPSHVPPSPVTVATPSVEKAPESEDLPPSSEVTAAPVSKSGGGWRSVFFGLALFALGAGAALSFAAMSSQSVSRQVENATTTKETPSTKESVDAATAENDSKGQGDDPQAPAKDAVTLDELVEEKDADSAAKGNESSDRVDKSPSAQIRRPSPVGDLPRPSKPPKAKTKPKDGVSEPPSEPKPATGSSRLDGIFDVQD